jgi:electron transport complex protein RnfG
MTAIAAELKNNYKDIVKPALVLFLITAIVVGLLAVVNGFTAEKIEENKVIAYQNSLKEVMPGAESFRQVKKEDALTVEQAFDASGTYIGSCVLVTTNGYGGKIEIMVGVGADGMVTSIDILSASETAGLGAKASGDKFRGQFEGRSEAKLKKDGGEIDAISGATITSRAVTNAVAAALESVQTKNGEGK